MPRRWLAPDFFTDEKMKKATVPERLLAAAIIANQDDDGRLRGDPAYLRAIAFLYDDYSLEEVKVMRDHLSEVNPNIIVYQNSGEEYIQLRRYKRYQKPRYYHPSKIPAPPGWPFEEESNQGVTTQQPSSNQTVTTKQPKRRRSVTTGEGEDKNLNLDLDLDLNKGEGEGPERHPAASPVAIALLDNFPKAFGREPDSREKAYLRDIGREISAAGATGEQVYDAYKEAAVHNKLHLSYVHEILRQWLGISRK
jgi:hypothetical protein